MAEYEKREGLEKLVLDPAEYAARKRHAQLLAARLGELKQENK
jgi:uncharacterized Fe-S cluster-containing radical SAM superfamily enzyme